MTTAKPMTIQRRIKISNLLMILVPACVSAVVGALAVVAAWTALSHGSGIGTSDSDDFFEASNVVAAATAPLVREDPANDLAQATYLARMLDASSMSLAVLSDGAVVYSYGAISPHDEELLAAARSIESDVELSSSGRCLSAKRLTAGDAVYQLCLLGDAQSGSDLVTESVVAIAACALVLALIVTVVLTNRFLTLFVLRHVTNPLEELTCATQKIRDGELAFRLPDGRTDEFAPVYAGFNDMAQRLGESVERDRRADEQRATLIVGLSHDLRSPLTSIQAYTEGLLDGIASDESARERYLRMIKQKAEEMGDLLKRLSHVAKLDHPTGSEPLARVFLDEFARTWVSENEGAYALRGVRIETDLAQAEALIDPELMRRSLANLLDNCASYACTPEAPTCHVVLSCRTGEKGGAVLTVDDDGPGVADEELAHLFDLFYRGDEARSTTSEGNGIGLAVVARAAERMGATARAARSSLGGLRVALAFPPCAPAPAPAPHADADARAHATAQHAGSIDLAPSSTSPSNAGASTTEKDSV